AGCDSRGNDVGRQAFTLPDLPSGRQVVATGTIRAADNDLSFAAMFNNERRGPAGRLVARGAPEFVASSLVEGDDEVFLFVVPGNDDGVAIERGRCAFAK